MGAFVVTERQNPTPNRKRTAERVTKNRSRPFARLLLVAIDFATVIQNRLFRLSWHALSHFKNALTHYFGGPLDSARRTVHVKPNLIFQLRRNGDFVGFGKQHFIHSYKGAAVIVEF